MKLRLVALGFVCGIATTLSTHQALSGGEGDEKSDDDRLMERWQQYALPGENHVRLEQYVGDWVATTKHWMEGPGKKPSVNTMSISHRLIFGDRFLETTMAGNIKINHNGEEMTFPIEAKGYTGYDNFKEKYVSVWLDSNSTAIYYCEGLGDASGQAITYYTTWDDWPTGQRGKPIKMVDRFLDTNTYIGEIFDLTDDTMAMEMTCRRK